MDIIQTIFLALIQGLTEFFPISSSAHLILTSHFLNWEDQGLTIDIALHFGSLIAIVFYFRNQFFTRRNFVSIKLMTNMVIAVIPIVIVAPFLADIIERQLRSVGIIGALLIAFGVVLYYAQKYKGNNELETMKWHTALIIGLAQILALFPGVSRSGVTISAGMFMGLSALSAIHFSFYLAIPTIFGAASLQMYRVFTQSIEIDYSILAIAITTSSLFSYIALRMLVSIVRRFGVTPFVVYRLALGLILISITLT